MFHTSALARELASELDATLVKVLHHHAHCAALVLDNRLDWQVLRVYITCDGVGYGEDGTAWGGEIFCGNLLNLERAASLVPLKMPGGDTSVQHPARMLASILHHCMDKPTLGLLLKNHFSKGFPHGNAEIDLVLDQLYSVEQMPLSSGTGRVLDGMSVLLGACLEQSYEGEPAIRLEGLADRFQGDCTKLIEDYQDKFKVESREDGKLELDVSSSFLLAVEKITENMKMTKEDRARHARAFHVAFAKQLADMAILIARKNGISEIGFSGGVSVNAYFLREIQQATEAAGFTFHFHHDIPPGDGGISMGQALLACLIQETN